MVSTRVTGSKKEWYYEKKTLLYNLIKQ